MPETQDARVAVYLDFDNIVISWYDRVHGRNAYGKDRQRITDDPNDAEVVERLKQAMIEVGAIIDYASSFGTLVLTRAYAAAGNSCTRSTARATSCERYSALTGLDQSAYARVSTSVPKDAA